MLKKIFIFLSLSFFQNFHKKLYSKTTSIRFWKSEHAHHLTKCYFKTKHFFYKNFYVSFFVIMLHSPQRGLKFHYSNISKTISIFQTTFPFNNTFQLIDRMRSRTERYVSRLVFSFELQ